MVSKVEVGGAGGVKKRGPAGAAEQNQQAAAAATTTRISHHGGGGRRRLISQNEMQKQVMIQLCNKDKVNKFKRSSSSTLEEDGLSTAILLLACIAISCPNP